MPQSHGPVGLRSVYGCVACSSDRITPRPVLDHRANLDGAVDKITHRRLPMDVVRLIRTFASSLVPDVDGLKRCLGELNAGTVHDWFFVYCGTWNVPCNIGIRYLQHPSLIFYTIDGDVHVRYKRSDGGVVFRQFSSGDPRCDMKHISSQYFTGLGWGGRLVIYVNRRDLFQIETCGGSIHTIRAIEP